MEEGVRPEPNRSGLLPAPCGAGHRRHSISSRNGLATGARPIQASFGGGACPPAPCG